ncbi:MAG: DUF3078 domain-containing protein [Hyphomicrobiales bacterium]
MKKHVIIVFILLFISNHLLADTPIVPHLQKSSTDTTKRWVFSGITNFTINQISLTNWASGGESSVSGKASINLTSEYRKNKYQNKTNLILAYGLQGFAENRYQKTDDRIDFYSSFNYIAFKDWSYSSLISLKTQFSDGFKYPDDSTIISAFFAPAYLGLSIGLNYMPSDNFSLLLSPLGGRIVFVYNQELANAGAFGVRKAVIDDKGNVIRKGSNILGELGINIVSRYQKDILENVSLETSLSLYNNYVDDNKDNRWNIDVDWETNINFVVNKYISALFYFHLIYDHNVKITETKYIDGEKTTITKGPRTQFKESLGLSFVYKL